MSLFDFSIGGWRPFHVFDDPADFTVNAIHLIPGVDWAGDALKTIAKNPIGFALLDIMSSGIMSSGGLALTNSTALGASSVSYIANPMANSIASMSFAIPGMLAGDTFWKAYTTDLWNRVKQTAAYLIGAGAAEAAGAALAGEIPTAISDAVTQIQNDPSLQQLAAAAGTNLQDMTTKLVNQGVKNVSDYVSQKALDAINHTDLASQLNFNVWNQQVDASGSLMVSAANVAQVAAAQVESDNEVHDMLAQLYLATLERSKTPGWMPGSPKLYMWQKDGTFNQPGPESTSATPIPNWMGLIYNTSNGHYSGPGVLMADYLKRLQQLQGGTTTAASMAALTNTSGYVPTQSEKDVAYAKIAALQATELADPNSWLAKEAAKTAAAAAAPAKANVSKLNAYFAKYAALGSAG